MTKIANIEKNKWLRPWDIVQHDDLYNRDDRFFSVLIKGVINFLNSNIVMYGKPINHFVFNTGSSYQYLEKNNYEFKWATATTNDTIYMKLPRCVISVGNISTIASELTQPYARGVYERRDNNEIKGYNAEIRRLPIELDMVCHYVLANFNESVILQQEIFDKLVFQRYFKITYLGQIIECSIEFPSETSVSVNKIDMESKETNMQTIDLSLKIQILTLAAVEH